MENSTTDEPVRTGMVVGFVGGLARIATARGVIDAEFTPPLGLGDPVTVQGGRVVRRVRGEGLVHHV